MRLLSTCTVLTPTRGSVSASNIASLGDHFATADDCLVFADTSNAAVIHILNAKTLVWSTAELVEGLERYFVTAGNYLFYSGSFAYTLIVYNITDNTWQTFEEQYEMADSGLIAFKYQTYAIFASRTTRSGYVTAWNTVNGVTRSTLDYGGNYRLFPTISVAGDYLVIAGGVFETDYSSDFSIYNPKTGQQFTGNMPTARYAMTIVYVEPLMLFIKDSLVESFNLNTQQWQSDTLEVELSETRVATGHKLFMVYGTQNYVIEFDSTSQTWSNITFSGTSAVGTLAKLADLAAFIDTNSIVVFNPQTQHWSRAQFSSAKQFASAFVVGDKVLIVSTDDQTVDVAELSQLAEGPVIPQASPVATPVSTPTASPTTVPWSPWTMPVANPSAAPKAAPTASPTTVPWSPWTMPVASPTTTPTVSPTAEAPLTSEPTAAPSVVSTPTSSPVAVTGPTTVPSPTNLVTSSASLTVLSGASLFVAIALCFN